jgi:hypothetical protein
MDFSPFRLKTMKLSDKREMLVEVTFFLLFTLANNKADFS